ncbi:hypothetical protein OsI_38298 [Oryza sativa Indica Group]|uniref:Transposase-associated domain-containing protein n=1 Tax=Oryza sativa subsp. indica TaxID=39946 RepID=B8BPL3_ORYSI|nr:hypothetical protein OsI_38298 [Oryza sativa Indica Group]
METDRSWMYKGHRKCGEVTAEWISKTTEFLDKAFSRVTGRAGVLCPCNYCNNTRPQTRDMMMKHLCKFGFRPAYTVWVYHGETYPARESDICQSTEDEDRVAEIDQMDEMIDDVHDAYVSVEEEDPEPTAQAFFQMLSAATQPLHEHTQVSQLDAITRLLGVKSQYAISIAGFDALLNVICALLPQGHKLPANLYEAKKVLSALNMPYEKIDACPKNCMLFRKENAQKMHCDKCGESRYVEVEDSNGHKKQLTVARKVLRYLPFIPRIQRLYMSESQAKQMTWHKNGHRYHPDKIGDSTSRGVPRHLTREEWNAAMLKFIDEEWTRRGVPTRQQQENILRNGAGRDRPNFVYWFYQQCYKFGPTIVKHIWISASS